ncbi:MAG TPA: DUF1592 domain-containing protein, partial [Planctomycetaceae bacterium]|nr:DUF1592 domain-containing protein [Planctomycetaceae bacterium]
ACVADAADEKAASPEPVADRIQSQVVPLLKTHCIACHSPEKKRGGLDLTPFTTELSVLKARKTWETVQRMLRAGEMPPEDRPQPTLEEKERLLKAVDGTLNDVDCSRDPDPGRVTIRRLNRTEYNNTIRDLVGVSFRPAEDFPADDIGYGFDHIGDVLSLPPLLFEKYMAAAERILSEAIREGEPVNGPIRRYSSREMKWTGPDVAQERNKYGRVLHTNGELQAELELAQEYEFVANVRIYCDPAGPEPVKAALRLDGRDVRVLETRERNSKTYPVRMTIPAGKHILSVAFINDYYDPDNPDPMERDRNLVLEYVDMQGPIDKSPTLSEQLLLVCRPAADGHDAATCARRIIDNFVTRAFRRPATADEIELYAGVYEGQRAAGESYERALRLALSAVLVSPRFLFRIEADPAAEDPATVRVLSDYELASRLSYFLWSSMPDAELFAVAARGELRRPDVLRQQVRRMLHDPKRQALIENFAGQWLQLRNLSVLAPDKGAYPNFDEGLRQAMRRETELFFETIVEEDRSLLEFLDANYTFVNGRLAKHYGLDGIDGDLFQRVNFPNDQRGGVLSHASILTVTSNPTRTSPVKRGKWVLENLLGTVPPPPPPMVKELDESAGEALKGSLRQRMEQHRANPSCASCHQRMDPLGFGLENFDGIGGWRTKDGEFTIDPSGDLPSGESFKTPKELRAILFAHKQEFARCLTEKMLTYALGRGLEYYDKCATDGIAAAVQKADYRFSTLIEEIVMSVPFQKRRAVKGEQ